MTNDDTHVLIVTLRTGYGSGGLHGFSQEFASKDSGEAARDYLQSLNENGTTYITAKLFKK